MLGKLIKHDFNSLSRVLVPTNLAIIGATVLATLGIAFNFRVGFTSFSDSLMIQIIQVIFTFIIGIAIIAIIAAFVFSAFIVFYRFYKNFMTNEGYLTFTLPVKTTDLLWSKLITAVIWYAISAVIGILCMFIFLVFGTSGDSLVNMEVLEAIGKALKSLSAVYTGGVTVIIFEILFFVLVASIASIMQVYLALVIGGAVAQKHKLLAGIGFYFAINTAVGTVFSLIQIPFINSLAKQTTADAYSAYNPYSVQDSINAVVSMIQPYYWALTVYMLLYSAGFFVLSHYFLKNKLNLQ